MYYFFFGLLFTFSHLVFQHRAIRVTTLVWVI